MFDRLRSFDRQTEVTASVSHFQRDRLAAEDDFCIARGGGLSYAACSFGAATRSIVCTELDHVLAFDHTAGLITVQAGITLGELLATTQRRGWMPAVLPGHPAITLGGALAVDAHGKQPVRDGCIGNWVRDCEAVDYDGHALDRPARTIGTFGLYGILTSVTLQLVPAPPSIEQRATFVDSIDDYLAELEAGDDALACYGWWRAERCQGLVFTQHAAATPLASVPKVPAGSGRGPVCLWTPATARLANRWFASHHRRRPATQHSLAAASFPLATQPNYLRAWGHAGPAQLQWLVPQRHAACALDELTQLIQSHGATVPLIAVKRFAAKASGIGFGGEGLSLAIDYKPNARGIAFASALDARMLHWQARPNLAKDSRIDAATAKLAIPELQAMLDNKHPRARSTLAIRLSL